MHAVVEASMSVGGDTFIRSGADAAIRVISRAVELRFLEQIRRVVLSQSLFMSVWVCLGLLGSDWVCLGVIQIVYTSTLDFRTVRLLSLYLR